jgi:hypothetical protein
MVYSYLLKLFKKEREKKKEKSRRVWCYTPAIPALKAEVGGSPVQEQPELHRKFEASLGGTASPCERKKIEKRKRDERKGKERN